jgi:hypothetical protein
MIWGGPKLTIEFVKYTGDDGKDLICSIFNEPIKSRILRSIGVRRETGDLNASFDVFEEGSLRLLLRGITGLLLDATARTQGLVVRSRPHFHSGFPVILCREAKTFVHKPREENLIEIAPGHYRARVLIVCDDKSRVVEKGIQLDPNPVKSTWV